MTTEESSEWLLSLRRIREAQRTALKIDHVYYFYNEDTTHHFHTWMVPRYDWMKSFGRSIESVRPALLHAQTQFTSSKDIENLKGSVELLRQEIKLWK